jgi:guanidinobutyrase / D-arginase
MDDSDPRGPVGPVDALRVPRFAGLPTFARLPSLQEVGGAMVAVLGVPFDSGVTYRPGARFGPEAVRQASRLLRPYHPGLDIEPFDVQQVADAGDVACNPFDIREAIGQIQAAVHDVFDSTRHVVAIGGDHTVALPMLRAVNERAGRVALVHFDAHLDTWDTYFGAPYTHGTPFRRAFEEGLLAEERSIHVGTRGPLYARTDLSDDASMGFRVIPAIDLETQGSAGVVERIRDCVGDAPVYVSIDVDVLDPAFAPGTGTPEAGGLSSRELLGVLRGLAGLPIVSADIVEVSPPYDHAQTTAIAASHLAYELISLIAGGRKDP